MYLGKNQAVCQKGTPLCEGPKAQGNPAWLADYDPGRPAALLETNGGYNQKVYFYPRWHKSTSLPNPNCH